MSEEWQYIESNPTYAVNDQGEVVNLKYGRPLKPVATPQGYLKVMLRKDGITEQHYIHQLVAEAFLSDWRPGVRIRHEDRDRTNNRVDNLSIMGGERRTPATHKYRRSHARRLRIVETGEVFRTAYDCADFIGGSATSIYQVLRGERRRHLGYTFEYLEETNGR